jgi:hypothetical protein
MTCSLHCLHVILSFPYSYNVMNIYEITTQTQNKLRILYKYNNLYSAL